MPMAMLTGKVKVSGNPLRLQEVFGALDDFSPRFNVIEPLAKP
jgi:alkyl sulfatase BDS1-like metallo-beta-lactamase superfamily hydrolase